MKININPNTETYRAQMLVKIDQEAEAFRNQFITPGSGQAMVYLTKETEARAIQSNPAAYAPHIKAEASARGISESETAQLVIATADNWRELSSLIEGRRMEAKLKIEAAATVAKVREASEVNWGALIAPEP